METPLFPLPTLLSQETFISADWEEEAQDHSESPEADKKNQVGPW